MLRQSLGRGIVVIPSLDLIQADPDLQDALIETPDLARFLPPQVFEGLMLLEELAAIELRDAVQQSPRGSLVTPVAHRPGL